MTAHEVLAILHARGVRVRVVGDRLRLAPAGVLTPELLAIVREHKPGIIAVLTTSEITTKAECGWCHAALAPWLVNRAGHPALVCTSCHRWTVVGGAS